MLLQGLEKFTTICWKCVSKATFQTCTSVQLYADFEHSDFADHCPSTFAKNLLLSYFFSFLVLIFFLFHFFFVHLSIICSFFIIFFLSVTYPSVACRSNTYIDTAIIGANVCVNFYKCYCFDSQTSQLRGPPSNCPFSLFSSYWHYIHFFFTFSCTPFNYSPFFLLSYFLRFFSTAFFDTLQLSIQGYNDTTKSFFFFYFIFFLVLHPLIWVLYFLLFPISSLIAGESSGTLQRKIE